MAAKNVYSLWIGALKALKNELVVLGGAAGVYLLETRMNWLPPGYEWIDVLVGGFLAYLVKNKLQFEE